MAFPSSTIFSLAHMLSAPPFLPPCISLLWQHGNSETRFCPSDSSEGGLSLSRCPGCDQAKYTWSPLWCQIRTRIWTFRWLASLGPTHASPEAHVRMDNLAKRALLAALVNEKFIDREISFENISLSCEGKRASTSPTKSIYSWWGYNTARALFHSKKIVHKEHIKLILWDGMDKLMNKRFPRMFGNFVTKHVL